MTTYQRPSIEQIRELFVAAGAHLYGGEAISQKEHSLQAAWFAERNNEPDTLIAACLLHDLGHVLFDENDDQLKNGIDDRHQIRVIPYLSALFPTEVTAPISMHVDAKRYLCYADSGYHRTLSAASRTSLELQGGVMLAEEAAKFLRAPFAQQAIALRRYDDAAKVIGLETPDFDHFLPRLHAMLGKDA
ncbi:phosphonate degradation HD-domain oxygenase [Noviherbaspirillum malthae]|jgi:phosphonate degradation associated HDIG domain protein|uniref:phosphonate degradation HD-domain oxygenase n=1 Tax=Noviherbaspirillum malthae TaxID=1260987 RepID=UPI00189006ED|nr:phosphonate degradation HD-domain oxygenase [Noviherbaspirillum malthae]